VIVTFSPSQQIRVRGDVLFQVVDEEAVLLDLKTERYLGLDAIGTRMWLVLTTAPSIESACGALLAEFEVDDSRLRMDVGEFVQTLVEYGLVEVTGP
jgi:hypothetical protein